MDEHLIKELMSNDCCSAELELLLNVDHSESIGIEEIFIHKIEDAYVAIAETFGVKLTEIISLSSPDDDGDENPFKYFDKLLTEDNKLHPDIKDEVEIFEYENQNTIVSVLTKFTWNGIIMIRWKNSNKTENQHCYYIKKCDFEHLIENHG